MFVRMNVGLSAGAVVCCRRLGQCDSSDTFKQKVIQEWANPWSPSKAEATHEVDDGRTLSVVHVRSRGSSRTPWQNSQRSIKTSGSWASTSGACFAGSSV